MSPDNSNKIILHIMGTSLMYRFDQPVIRLGRAGDNDLVIEDTFTSRQHARIDCRDGHFDLTDLDSTSGTYVNGNEIETYRLVEGDVITLGTVHLVFEREEYPDQEASTPAKPGQKSSQSNQNTTDLSGRKQK